MIKVIETIEAFLSLEKEWDSLYDDNSVLTPFQSFKYNYLSWTAFMHQAGHLFIIIELDNNSNQLEAVFPCYIDEHKTLRFINDRHTDFCSAIVRRGREFDFQLYEEFASFVLSDAHVKMICFDNLVSDNPLTSVLKPFCNRLFVNDINAYSTIDIEKQQDDKSFLDSIRNISGKRKKKLSTQLSKEHDLQMKILHKEDNHTFPIEEVLLLMNTMTEKGERTADYFSNEMLDFWKQMYDSGLLSVALLYQGNRIKSVNFMFYNTTRNEYIKWIVLYADKRYNLLINLKLIENFHGNGGARINFARGIYDYKMMNFHPQVKNLYRLTISKSVWSSIKALFALNLQFSKIIAKSILRK